MSTAPEISVDMALLKRVRIGESKTFTVRADGVNILNRPIWGNPNTNINSTTFGRITTATGNRTIAFNARVDFRLNWEDGILILLTKQDSSNIDGSCFARGVASHPLHPFV